MSRGPNKQRTCQSRPPFSAYFSRLNPPPPPTANLHPVSPSAARPLHACGQHPRLFPSKTGTQFFDSLMAWLPVRENCPAQADGALLGTMCSVASEDAAEELPSLSFRCVHSCGPCCVCMSIRVDPAINVRMCCFWLRGVCTREHDPAAGYLPCLWCGKCLSRVLGGCRVGKCHKTMGPKRLLCMFLSGSAAFGFCPFCETRGTRTCARAHTHTRARKSHGAPSVVVSHKSRCDLQSRDSPIVVVGGGGWWRWCGISHAMFLEVVADIPPS